MFRCWVRLRGRGDSPGPSGDFSVMYEVARELKKHVIWFPELSGMCSYCLERVSIVV